jgi:hypothetical protein
MLDYSCVYVQTKYRNCGRGNRGSSKYKYMLSSTGARHGTLPQWSYGLARCTIQACTVLLTQTTVRDFSQELEALSSAAVRCLMSFEDTLGLTSIIHPGFMQLIQHYIGTHATSSRGGIFMFIHTPTQARLLQKVPERRHYTVASVGAWDSILGKCRKQCEQQCCR